MKSAWNKFWPNVNKSGPIPAHVPEIGPCWEWTASTFKNGYGLFSISGNPSKVHRWVYSVANGPIPEGFEICHKCDNRKCVRPSHLFIGTRSDNMRDCVAKGRWSNGNHKKTHCPSGHPYSGDNLRITNEGHRKCKICDVQQTIKSRKKRLSKTAAEQLKEIPK